jgi:ABC-type Na+ efflux pump permease subunit
LADPRVAIARRELSVLRKEKTIVLALLIQLFIAAFSSFLVVGLVSLYDPGSVGGYTVETAVTGDASDDLLAAVDDREGVSARSYPTQSAAMDAFEERRVDAVLVATHADGRIAVRATVPDSNVRTTLAVVQIRDALRAFERAERTDRAASLDALPLELPPSASSSPYYGFTYTLLVPLLLFLPVFISGSITVDSITEEFERGTLELLRVAPLSLTDIVDGKVAAAAVLAPAQAALWVGLLGLNGTTVARPFVLLAVVASLSLLVVSLAAATALFAPDRRVAQLFYSTGVLVAFGGSTLLPVNPANTVARLAIGSAHRSDLLAVAGYVVVSVVAVAAVRRAVKRLTL